MRSPAAKPPARWRIRLRLTPRWQARTRGQPPRWSRQSRSPDSPRERLECRPVPGCCPSSGCLENSGSPLHPPPRTPPVYRSGTCRIQHPDHPWSQTIAASPQPLNTSRHPQFPVPASRSRRRCSPAARSSCPCVCAGLLEDLPNLECWSRSSRSPWSKYRLRRPQNPGSG